MNRVSVYIIAYNEAEKIRDAIHSVLWADEIVLADSHSQDNTAAIAGELGARVVQIDFRGFGDLRNRAMAACTHDWIFSLDADERCTPEARDEILACLADPRADAYYIPRRNFFMGRWMRHSGFYPDYRQPQLIRKGVKLKVTYHSPLTRLQRYGELEAIMATAEFTAMLAKIDQSATFKLDVATAIEAFTDRNGTPAIMVRDAQQVAAMQQRLAEQQAAAAEAQQAQAGAAAARDMAHAISMTQPPSQANAPHPHAVAA